MKKIPVLHPFLFAVYPLLFLISQNTNLFVRLFVLKAIFIVAIASLLSWVILKIILRNAIIAGLVCSMFVVWLFFYHPFYYSLLKIMTIGKLLIWRNCIVIPLWTIIILFLGYMLLKKPSRAVMATKVFNIISLVLVSWSVVNISVSLVKSGFFNNALHRDLYRVSSNDTQKTPPAQTGAYPDIYCIILDAYTSNVVLEELYNFSNEDFLNALITRDFYVFRDAKSNYPRTSLSMAALFNMEYHNKVKDEKDWWKDLSAISRVPRNLIATYLVSQGYTFMDKQVTEVKDPQFLKYLFFSGIVKLSFLRELTKVYHFGLDGPYRRNILSCFKWLQNIKKNPNPIFVYTHILSPHYPFVFNAQGGKVGLLKIISLAFKELKLHRYDYAGILTDIMKALYVEQLQFINQETIRTMDAIISNAQRPCIIIVMGDHGFFQGQWAFDPNDKKYLRQRFGILQAYYFSDKDYSRLYEGFTPVNIFRLILKQYFNEDITLLEDKSYIFHEKTAYDVTKLINSK